MGSRLAVLLAPLLAVACTLGDTPPPVVAPAPAAPPAFVPQNAFRLANYGDQDLTFQVIRADGALCGNSAIRPGQALVLELCDPVGNKLRMHDSEQVITRELRGGGQYGIRWRNRWEVDPI